MVFRIFHFADMHLDRSFGDTGLVSSRLGRGRRDELREVLRQLCQVAQQLEADVITIGGDLYESERVTRDTANFLSSTFSSLAPIKVIIAPGNHDPFTPDSLYRQVSWPANVRIFTCPTLEWVHLGNDLYLWAAAHQSQATRENLIRGVRAPPTGTHLLLLHASDETTIPAGKPAHCPFSPQDIQAAGFRVALLGHYHQAACRAAGNSIYAYPGSPEPLGFDEEGDHQAILLEISEGVPNVTFHKTNLKTYHKAKVDVSDAESWEDIRRLITNLTVAGSANFVRVTLEGHLQPSVDLNMDSLLTSCADRFGYLDIVDQTMPAYDLEALKSEPTVRGRFVGKMLARIQQATSDDERIRLEKALYYGLRSLHRQEIHRR